MNEFIEKNYKDILEKSTNITVDTINAYKDYLISTDYVVIKISELMVQGVSSEELVVEYQDVLNDRARARELINELENTL